MQLTPALRWRVFACACIAINLVAFLMVPLAPRPAVGIGAAFGLQQLISLLPLCLLGLLRATYLAPQITWARPAVAAATELTVAALIAVRMRIARCRPGG